MPGNWTYTAFTDQQLLTHTDLNAMLQNILDNATPSGLDDYSANDAQMLAKADPGEVGSLSLATSVAGDLERLRFIIAEMKRTTDWVTTIKTAKIDHPFVMTNTTSHRQWPNSVQTFMDFMWRVPHDYHSDLATLKIMRRLNTAVGTAVMRLDAWRARDGAALQTAIAGNVIDFAPGDTNCHIAGYNIPASEFIAGDMLIWRISREGADAGDTHTGAVNLDGAAIEYTGYAGGR